MEKEKQRKNVFFENAQTTDPDDIDAPWQNNLTDHGIKRQKNALDRFLDKNPTEDSPPGNVPGEDNDENIDESSIPMGSKNKK